MKNPKPYLEQSFEQIKLECQNKNVLFEDEHFSKNNPHTFGVFNSIIDSSLIEWKRPKDFIPEPQLFVNDPNPNDINQGDLNC